MRLHVMIPTVLISAALSFAAVHVGPQVIDRLTVDDSKPGWLDDADLSSKDQRRLQQLRGETTSDGAGAGYAAYLTGRSLSRRDFELMRQDRRRARAAYPEQEVTYDAWVTVNLRDRVPEAYNTSGNGDSTQGSDGRWYLDGSSYVALVKPQFTKRATPAEVKAWLARKDDEAKVARLARDRIYWSWSTSDGLSYSVNCTKAKACSVFYAAPGSTVGTCWTFPFVPTEWADKAEQTIEEVKLMPAFQQAKAETVHGVTSGVTITTGTGQTVNNLSGMVIQPGESIQVNVPITSP